MNQLIADVKQNNRKIFLEFGGQGAPYLKELAKLYHDKPELQKFFQVTFKVIERYRGLIGSSSVFSEGFDLEKWLQDPESAPSDTYLMRANVSIPAIMATQCANYLLFTLNGYPVAEIRELVGGSTGHSQGVVAAAMASIAVNNDFYEVYEKFFEYQLLLGLRAQEAYPAFDVTEADAAEALALGDKSPAPMAAVIGYTAEEIIHMTDSFNREQSLPDASRIYPALFNTVDSIVISAPLKSLLAFRKRYKAEMDEKKVKFVYLRTTAPFHSPHMKGCEAPFMKDLENLKFDYSGKDLAFPVFSFHNGRNFQDSASLGRELFAEVALEQLFWEKAVSHAFRNEQIELMFDFGPGKTIQSLTQSYMTEGSNLKLYCVSNPKDAKVIFG